MSPGRLDRRITLQSNTPTVGSVGESIPNWSSLATVWANKRDESGSEAHREGLETATARTFFTIRHRADVSTQTRVSYSSTLYDIESIREFGMRAEWLELNCKRRTDS